ncbi:hypothetical protein NDA11_007045 [Ustilago hordei]|uniref:tRNA N(3)-methylcytidine methyltransferase n=1 Tax=Ustilago hordei TaxID=120017 RepID=I2FTV9_USTHO|nr:uncharacterized protein UHO2_06146 [Ustilago hordei]KAJ1037860.1 hypothetical protein NDA10_005898 [Ustilago hordei]KAJ1574961.1 hypothetical protein NDA15_002828 [Ustilago hordei]KAJ1594024.1 hypothetical protein NDA12_003059 [Ustilago hordei]KAJ1594850.1 hypothetical protein NDA11_007045 [Ustilago hordei]KAJ1597551.1 hypothetical protein NDA14_003700 [Ustilago hordei]
MTDQPARSAPAPAPAPHESLPEQPEVESTISSLISTNRRSATDFAVKKHSAEAAKNWDKFYKNHQDKFFKDRHWTSREFSSQLPSASSSSSSTSTPLTASSSTGKAKGEDDREEETTLVSQQVGNESGVLLEVGCGVGNMLYPLLNTNPSLRVHCCDFSSRAVDLVKSQPQYDPARVNAFVFDLTSPSPPLSTFLSVAPYNTWPSVTTISLIFVLSAIPPNLHAQVLRSLKALLPQGGHILFRDYAYGDLSQVRYHTKKDAAWAEPSLLTPDPEHNWYRRGDNTFNYFFRKEQLEELARQVGLEAEVEVLRRTAINRRSEVNMQRRFVQAKWYVPPTESPS